MGLWSRDRGAYCRRTIREAGRASAASGGDGYVGGVSSAARERYPAAGGRPGARDGSSAGLLALDNSLELGPAQGVQYRFLLEARAASLVDAAANEVELANAVRVGGNGDQDAGFARQYGVFRG